MLYNYFFVAVPIIMQLTFMLLNNLILTIFAASLNDTVKLAGVGLGVSIIAVGISSILMGINGAI